MAYLPPTLRCPTPPALLRLRNDIPCLRPLGDRVLFELLAEIGREHDCLDDVAARVAKYRRLTPEMLAVTGGDRFPTLLTTVPR